MCNARDRFYVRPDRASRAIRGDRQLRARDLERQRAHVARRTGTGAGQSDVGGMDTQLRHQVQDLDLLVYRGIGDGGALQSVPERLIVELYTLESGKIDSLAGNVPVVDQVLLLH